MPLPWEIPFNEDAANLRALAEAVAAGERPHEFRTPGWVNILDFGAVGDGVADDTDAIERALNHPNTRVLYFPAGTYLVGTETSHVRVRGRRGLALLGDGPQSRLLRPRGNPLDLVKSLTLLDPEGGELLVDAVEGMIEFESCFCVRLQGLSILANGFVPPLDVRGLATASFDRLAGADPLDAAIVFRDCMGVWLNDLSVDHGDHQVYWPGGRHPDEAFHKFAFRLESCQDVSVTSCRFRGIGLQVSNVSRARILANTFLDIEGHAVALDAGAANLSYVDVMGNVIQGCTGYGVVAHVPGSAGQVLDVRHVRIQRNVIRKALGLSGGIVFYSDFVHRDTFDAAWTYQELSIVGNEVEFPRGGFEIDPSDANLWLEGEYPLRIAVMGVLVCLHGEPDGPDDRRDAINVVKFGEIRDNVVRNCMSGNSRSGVSLAISHMFGAAVSGNGAYSPDAGLQFRRIYRCHVYSNRVEDDGRDTRTLTAEGDRAPGGGLYDYEVRKSYGDNIFDANVVLGGLLVWGGEAHESDLFLGGLLAERPVVW